MVNQQPHLHAYLVTRDDGKIDHFHDLDDKMVALPNHSLEHCRLFFRRRGLLLLICRLLLVLFSHGNQSCLAAMQSLVRLRTSGRPRGRRRPGP